MNLWCKNPNDLSPLPTQNIVMWLTKPYILSQALKRCCKELQVVVLSEEFNIPKEIDYPYSSIEQTFIRQVFLKGDDIPWTYGRVLIPAQTYERHMVEFGTLGTRLLGETLLYNKPHVSRSPFEYTLLNPSNTLFQSIYQNLSKDLIQEPLYGRRSLFYIGEDPLIVSEFLLPTIPSYR